jgi:hypothetical protein
LSQASKKNLATPLETLGSVSLSYYVSCDDAPATRARRFHLEAERPRRPLSSDKQELPMKALSTPRVFKFVARPVVTAQAPSVKAAPLSATGPKKGVRRLLSALLSALSALSA